MRNCSIQSAEIEAVPGLSKAPSVFSDVDTNFICPKFVDQSDALQIAQFQMGKNTSEHKLIGEGSFHHMLFFANRYC